jgi:beta-lactamase superfamily II metal-dependent hydrolase
VTDVLVVFLDVGQGDCTLVFDISNEEAILIDCPPRRSREAIAGLGHIGATRLSLAFASHSDLDHLGGLYEVLNSISVDEVRINLDSIVTAGDKAERTKLQAAQRAFAGLEDQGVALLPCYSGDSGHRGDVAWRALSPTHALLLLAQGRGDRNIASVILRLETAKVRVLIAGDAPAGAFARAMNQGEDLRADIFRLSHHGGRIDQLGGPTIGELLDEIGAQHHVISVGTGNGYGHPTLETLEELGRRSGRARVTCTEVNTTCMGEGPLPLRQADTLPVLARLGADGRNGACRCAGSISVRIDDDGWVVEPNLEDHDRVIVALDHPMCRLSSSTQVEDDPMAKIPSTDAEHPEPDASLPASSS